MGIKVDNIYTVPSTLVGREHAFSRFYFCLLEL